MNSLNDIPQALSMVFRFDNRSKRYADLLPNGFQLDEGIDKSSFYELLQGAGWACRPAQFKAMQESLIRNGMLIIRDRAHSSAVAMACLLALPDEGSGEISWLTVKKAYRHQGFGAALVSSCLQRFADAGKKSVFVRLEKDNLKAISLYSKMGFRPIYESDEAAEAWQSIHIKMANIKKATP